MWVRGSQCAHCMYYYLLERSAHSFLFSPPASGKLLRVKWHKRRTAGFTKPGYKMLCTSPYACHHIHTFMYLPFSWPWDELRVIAADWFSGSLGCKQQPQRSAEFTCGLRRDEKGQKMDRKISICTKNLARCIVQAVFYLCTVFV